MNGMWCDEHDRYQISLLNYMVVQSLQNLEKLGEMICVKESLEKSGNVTERFVINFYQHVSLETMLF